MLQMQVENRKQAEQVRVLQIQMQELKEEMEHNRRTSIPAESVMDDPRVQAYVQNMIKL